MLVQVSTGRWLGDCFVYTNANDRLNYCVGGEVQTLHHLDKRMYLLGHMAKENRSGSKSSICNAAYFELAIVVSSSLRWSTDCA